MHAKSIIQKNSTLNCTGFSLTIILDAAVVNLTQCRQRDLKQKLEIFKKSLIDLEYNEFLLSYHSFNIFSF